MQWIYEISLLCYSDRIAQDLHLIPLFSRRCLPQSKPDMYTAKRQLILKYCAANKPLLESFER